MGLFRGKAAGACLAVGLAIGALPACGAASALLRSTVPRAPASLAQHWVTPGQADPSVTGPGAPNLAMVARYAPWNGELFVFLPGSGGRPGCCQLLLREAVALGYHAIGLTYNNSRAVGTRCRDVLICYGLVRANVFDGSRPSQWSKVPAKDGVQHRLVALLQYLAQRYPAEGWGRFVAGQLPSYGEIVLGGHSQGGGEAGYIGLIRGLAGVVTLSSPPDTNSAHQPATWVTRLPHGQTPLARYIGFVHTGDPFFQRITADWQAMKLPRYGPRTWVDGVRAPYHGSHQLVSEAALPLVLLARHDATAVDSATPRCPDGSPRYASIWRTMLQLAGGLKVTAAPRECYSGNGH